MSKIAQLEQRLEDLEKKVAELEEAKPKRGRPKKEGGDAE